MTRSNPIQFSAGQRVTLAFRARWWYVDNPTGSTVYLREGNTDIPSGIASADMFVPALSARVIPCNASEFGLGFGSPFSTAPAGLPTNAVALFGDESEPMPSIGSEAALSVSALSPAETVLDSFPANLPNGLATHTITPGSDIRAVGLAAIGPGVSQIQVFGHTSGILYLNYDRATNVSQIPIGAYLGGVDEQLDVRLTVDATPDSEATIVGYRYVGARETDAAGVSLGRLTENVNIVPVAGWSFPYINSPPGKDVGGIQVAPGAGVVVCDTLAIGAGMWRIEAELGSDDTAAIGKFVELVRRNAANTADLRRMVCPVPGQKNIVLSQVQLAANERYIVRTGGVAAALSTYFGTIRAY